MHRSHGVHSRLTRDPRSLAAPPTYNHNSPPVCNRDLGPFPSRHPRHRRPGSPNECQQLVHGSIAHISSNPKHAYACYGSSSPSPAGARFARGTGLIVACPIGHRHQRASLRIELVNHTTLKLAAARGAPPWRELSAHRRRRRPPLLHHLARGLGRRADRALAR